MKDELKKELWKTIKPTSSSPLAIPDPKPGLLDQDRIIDNKYIRAYNKYKSSTLSDQFADKYKVDPNMLIYRGSVPLNQLSPNATTLVYMGGHFYIVPIGGLQVFPSGLNLGGWSRKTLSDKSRAIIENVYGMEIE